MGAIKTMKEVESALPQKKEINYVRALDKNGNPILINKEDLAQVVGELIWKKLPESERKKVTSAYEIIKEAEDKNVTVYVISAAAVLCAVGVFTVVRKCR